MNNCIVCDKALRDEHICCDEGFTYNPTTQLTTHKDPICLACCKHKQQQQDFVNHRGE